MSARPNLAGLRRRMARRATARVQVLAGTGDVLFTGRAYVRPTGRAASEVVTADEQVAVGLYDVTLAGDLVVPQGATNVRVLVVDTADPGLSGRLLSVLHVLHDDWYVAGRLVCQLVT